jgi:transcriptional regulator with XRE-family HTH domain
MNESDNILLPDVNNLDDVINFSQNQLATIIVSGDISPKDKVAALSTLSRTALSQKRLNVDNDSAAIQAQLAKAVLGMIDKYTNDEDGVVMPNRASTLQVVLPIIEILPGETSVIQEEFTFDEMVGVES